MWGAFISPTIFGLATSAQIIIWVMIGGLGTLIGPVLGAVSIQWLVTQIGGQQVLDANLVLGIILLVFVLLLPAGVVPTVERLGGALWRRGGAGKASRRGIAVPSDQTMAADSVTPVAAAVERP